MSPNSQVIRDLCSVLSEGVKYDLLNLYKGVPITCHVEVLSIEDDSAQLRVQPPELTSLVWERYTWLVGEGIEKPLQARVVSFDILAGTVRLDEFKPTSSRLAERSKARVEPKNPIPVGIESDNQRIVGTLADISVIGLGVYLYALEPEHAFHHAQVVQVSMRLPIEEGEVVMSGKIRGLVSSVDFHRMAVRFIPEPGEIAKVKRYVDQRREEILQEIPKLYETLLKSKTGEQPS